MMVTRTVGTIAALAIAVASCGGSDGDSSDGDVFSGGDASDGSEVSDEDQAALDEFADAIAEAQGAGGGGTLTFDGVETVIDSAVCASDGERVDVGTVGVEGYRVFVSGRADDPNLQILTPEGVQWFEGDPLSQDKKPTVVIEGSMITSTGGTFFNNVDDVLIVAEFTIECPNPLL